MSGGGLRWLVGMGVAFGAALWSVAGCDRSGGPATPPQSDAGVIGGGPDGGTGADGGDGGGGGGGGQDGGGPDGGPPRQIIIPGGEGWRFHGPESGAPREVWGVSSDVAGNLWVAGGAEGLLLLRPGAEQFERFTIADGLTPYVDEDGAHQQSVVSVAGGASNEVYAGYLGHFDGHEDADPPYMVKSGDADRVRLQGSGIAVQHVDLSTPPGVYSDPDVVNGRDKIRTVWRILRDPVSGNVWFGGNHGVALLEARTGGTVFEHQHAAINGCSPGGGCTLLSGDWFGIALDGAGDLWMGGGHRLARLQYSAPQRFWGPVEPILDVWPDASDADRTDDFVQDLAVTGSTVWVGSITNGLASVNASGVHPLPLPGYQGRVTALEGDPRDGSLWIGLQWGGVLRLSGGAIALYGQNVFGRQLIDSPVWDIQSDLRGPGGQRRILVAFRGGAVGIYTGR